MFGKKIRGHYWNQVYLKNLFGGAESRSGAGSSLLATKAVRLNLAEFLRDFGIRSLIDIPCGDFNWMKELELAGVTYLGLDSSAEIITMLSHKYPNHNWQLFDILSDQLPFSDCVLMRDLLVHLSIREIKSAIANVLRSGSTYLAVTNFTNNDFNIDFSIFHYRKRLYWRPINLQIEPFNFPAPIIRIIEGYAGNSQYQDKCLDIYLIRDLGFDEINS